MGKIEHDMEQLLKALAQQKMALSNAKQAQAIIAGKSRALVYALQGGKKSEIALERARARVDELEAEVLHVRAELRWKTRAASRIEYAAKHPGMDAVRDVLAARRKRAEGAEDDAIGTVLALLHPRED